MGDSLKRIIEQPREVWMVKMADRITNLAPPPSYWSNEKTSGYWEEASVIYNTLKEANSVLADRLNMKIEHYKRYMK